MKNATVIFPSRLIDEITNCLMCVYLNCTKIKNCEQNVISTKIFTWRYHSGSVCMNISKLIKPVEVPK